MANPINQIKEILSAPLGELISAVGKGVGEAQAALDENSMRLSLELYKQRTEDDEPLLDLLKRIGYQPTFYVIPETEVEAEVSITFSETNQEKVQIPGRLALPVLRKQISAMPINAGNINRYNLNSNAFAKIKFKIVPVPPLTEFSQVIELPDLLEGERTPKIGEVIENLVRMGLEYTVDGDTDREYINSRLGIIIKDQSPPAGTLLRLGDVVNIDSK